MPKAIFINLPVKDIPAATRFYQAIGCKQNDQFSDENASSMVWSDTITFQLLSRDYFKTFTPKDVADAGKTTEVLLAITCESRDEVDGLADAAAKTGGRADVREKMDMGWMYNRSFEDTDGHIFEAVWMDPKGMPD